MLTEEQRVYEESILNQLSKFLEKTDSELCDYFAIRANPLTGRYPNNVRGLIVNRMLDFDLNPEKSKEMRDFGISRYSIRVEQNGTIKESLSLPPTIVFKKLANETWDSSTLKNYLLDARYLFIVFKKINDGSYKFIGAKFWSMPRTDIDAVVEKAWKQTVDTINNGVELTYNEKRNRVENNFIKRKEERIIHVRPHAKKSSYHAYNDCADQLPVKAKWINKPASYSDDWMTKQCFWLNNSYIEKQINDLI